MTMTDPDETRLDALLADVARQKPEVSDALMAAVLRDAARMQPAPAPVRPGLWASLLDLIGGWPAMGGLAAAGLAGVWLGVAPPVALESATAALGVSQSIDLIGTGALETAFDLEVSE